MIDTEDTVIDQWEEGACEYRLLEPGDGGHMVLQTRDDDERWVREQSYFEWGCITRRVRDLARKVKQLEEME